MHKMERAAAPLRTGILLAGLAVLAAAPAAAGSGAISFPPSAAAAASGTPTIGTIIGLADDQSDGFTVNFVLPSGYKTNSTVKIAYYFSGQPNCNVRLAPLQVLRKRPGKTFLSSIAGLSPKGGGLVAFGSEDVIAKKIFNLKPDATFPDQRPGDGFTVAVQRVGSDTGDTCVGSVFVQNIEISFTTKTK